MLSSSFRVVRRVLLFTFDIGKRILGSNRILFAFSKYFKIRIALPQHRTNMVKRAFRKCPLRLAVSPSSTSKLTQAVQALILMSILKNRGFFFLFKL